MDSNVHVHEGEILLRFLERWKRSANLSARFWAVKSLFSPFQGHSEWLASETGSASLSLQRKTGLCHMWSCAGVSACLGQQGPLRRRKGVLWSRLEGDSAHFKAASRLKHPNVHQTTNPLAGTCIGTRLRLCESTSGGPGRYASARGRGRVFRS